MKQKIISADNKKVVVDCIGCALSRGEIDVIGGLVVETKNFTVAQDFEIPIPGFLIIGSKRHFYSFADLTDEEKRDFIELLIRVRKAMRDCLKIDKVTVVQEEKTTDSHFHVWLFPWYEWMEKIGADLSSIRKIMEYARKKLKTKENLTKIKKDIETTRAHLRQGY